MKYVKHDETIETTKQDIKALLEACDKIQALYTRERVEKIIQDLQHNINILVKTRWDVE